MSEAPEPNDDSEKNSDALDIADSQEPKQDEELKAVQKNLNFPLWLWMKIF